MGEYLNIIMILGIIIIILGIIYGLISGYKLKKIGNAKLSSHVKWRVVMLSIALFGAGIVQYGDNVRKMTFNEQEIKFIEENKKFSSFNEDDLILYYKTSFTYSKSKTKTYEKYYNQFLEWGVDKYLVGNEHRTITREEAKTFVEEKMNIDKNFYLENYCKILCK